MEQQYTAISELPAIVALFLIRFDNKIGYHLTWQRHATNIDLEGAVEFKSLPSGLHNVEQDLVYFQHADCAGMSAYENDRAPKAQRNASFLSVGVLVPLHGTRLAKIWLHASNLKNIAQELQKNPNHVEVLSSYWHTYGQNSDAFTTELQQTMVSSPGASTIERSQTNLASPTRRQRALSESAKPTGASSTHPAHSIHSMLLELGPLIFPLVRAVLLRQRVLFIQRPPLRKVCEFVYILSILSSLPQPVTEGLSLENLTRTAALFSVGVNDIPFLQGLANVRNRQNLQSFDGNDAEKIDPGWIACSSDQMLVEKSHLYDLRVEMPDMTSPAIEKHWSKIIAADGKVIKASQRDLRRYKSLMQSLNEMLQSQLVHANLELQDPAESIQTLSMPEEHNIVEPLPWAAIAYDSFVWWASAGERSIELEDESEIDHDLMRIALRVVTDFEVHLDHTNPNATTDAKTTEAFEMAVIAYFHQVSTTILVHACSLTNELDDEHVHASDPGTSVVITTQDLVKMGLDVWSKSDRLFTREIFRRYFGRQCLIQDTVIECCGIRLL